MKPLLGLLALAACASLPPQSEATAGLGGTARLGDVIVRPIAVLEDSRCPRDVTCIWAGRFRLSVAVSTVPGTSELVLGRRFALPGGGAIILVAATPDPWRFGFRREAD